MSLSPQGAWIKPQGTQQFTATATFGNNTTGDVTSQVSWTTSPTSIATVDSSGKVTGVALGSATLTAKSSNSSVTASAPITVSAKTITAITLNPASATIPLSTGQTQQFLASATFSDGTMQDITTIAAWSSSSTSIATITSSGVASPTGVGTTTISASAGGVVGTSSLTVTQ